MLDLDKKLFLMLNADLGSTADTIFLFLSSHKIFIILGIIALIIIWRKYGFWAAFIALIFIGAGIGTCDMIANIFKYHIEKFRPMYTADIQLQTYMIGYKISGGVYGTVSAHAATSFMLALFTSKVIKNWAYTIFVVLLALSISYSRIYLGVHFPSDLILGMLLGIVVALLYYKIFKIILNKILKPKTNIYKGWKR